MRVKEVKNSPVFENMGEQACDSYVIDDASQIEITYYNEGAII
jgi:hypothetical protein